MAIIYSGIMVVFFSDFENCHLVDTFDSVSYGDATFTLVAPSVLINELKAKANNETYLPLIEELSKISERAYVALDG